MIKNEHEDLKLISERQKLEIVNLNEKIII